MPSKPTKVRIWLVGFGTVGRWVAAALVGQRERLALEEQLALEVVGLASARDGFVGNPDGLDLAQALRLRSADRPLSELPDSTRHATALEGLRATEADVLVEVSLSPASDGEPGLSHMREAVGRRIPVITANKWPVALGGVELARLAHENAVQFRAESTVMSGTPVLGALTEGLAGSTPRSIRGILNATANFILTEIGAGASYDEALARAKQLGLSEPDPSDDVEGHDSVAKLMVLAGLVFGRQLDPGDVARRGISALSVDEIERARSEGLALREISSLAVDGAGSVAAEVKPLGLAVGDPLREVDGATNAILCDTNPLGELMITGPGAGIELAGQGVLSDLLAVSGELRRSRTP